MRIGILGIQLAVASSMMLGGAALPVNALDLMSDTASDIGATLPCGDMEKGEDGGTSDTDETSI